MLLKLIHLAMPIRAPVEALLKNGQYRKCGTFGSVLHSHVVKERTPPLGSPYINDNQKITGLTPLPHPQPSSAAKPDPRRISNPPAASFLCIVRRLRRSTKKWLGFDGEWRMSQHLL
jgi:hypothetical protein